MFRKIIKVFLASPGDLETERKAARRIVEEENYNHAFRHGYQFDLVGWEDTIAQYRRAQDAINRDLDQCEYFVGMMWRKWGTPPGLAGHPYSSGFEEEFRRSVERRNKSGKPEISLLFKNVEEDALADAGPDLRKVLEFQKEIYDSKQIIYQKFGELRDFEQRFRSVLALFLKQQLEEDSQDENSDPVSSKNEPSVSKNLEENNENNIFGLEAKKFIKSLISEEKLPDSLSATDVARFRLISASVNQTGNDEITLGSHDANLIYRDTHLDKLSRKEIATLIQAGIENFHTEVIPLWRWLFGTSKGATAETVFRTLFGSEHLKENAFKLLQLLNADLNNVYTGRVREDFITRWLSEYSHNDVKMAGLNYLTENGTAEDLQHIEPLLEVSEANVATAATKAKAGILANDNCSKALEFIANYDEVDFGSYLTRKLTQSISSISSEILVKCLGNKSDDFVLTIARVLFDRNEINRKNAESLCKRGNAEIRFIGALTLKKLIKDFSLNDARSYIIDPNPKNSLSLFGSSDNFDLIGYNAYEEYERTVLKQKSKDDLLFIVENSSLFHYNSLLALYDRYFSDFDLEITESLASSFEAYISAKKQKLDHDGHNIDGSTIKFIREKMTQLALEICASKNKGTYIDRIRSTLDNNEIMYSDKVVGYLQRHGNFDDVKRIIKLALNFRNSSRQILSIYKYDAYYIFCADAILQLSKKRIADTLDIEMPLALRSEIIARMPKTVFSNLDDWRIIDMLLSESVILRKMAAIKAVSCLSKARVEKIQNRYFQSQGIYYYNVIFWLDLKLSAPTNLVNQICSLATNRFDSL